MDPNLRDICCWGGIQSAELPRQLCMQSDRTFSSKGVTDEL